MQVILKQDVEGLGHAGDVKKVAAGYATNFLIPRGLATLATEGALKQAEQWRKAGEMRRAKERGEAEAMAAQVNGRVLAFAARAGENNRLYGSITSSDIAKALAKATGLTIDRRRIELEHSLREVGTHEVTIRFAPEVKATVTVTIQAEGEGQTAA